MAKIYYRRIKDGLMVVDDVPKRWKEEVLNLLAEELEV